MLMTERTWELPGLGGGGLGWGPSQALHAIGTRLSQLAAQRHQGQRD